MDHVEAGTGPRLTLCRRRHRPAPPAELRPQEPGLTTWTDDMFLSPDPVQSLVSLAKESQSAFLSFLLGIAALTPQDGVIG